MTPKNYLKTDRMFQVELLYKEQLTTEKLLTKGKDFVSTPYNLDRISVLVV